MSGLLSGFSLGFFGSSKTKTNPQTNKRNRNSRLSINQDGNFQQKQKIQPSQEEKEKKLIDSIEFRNKDDQEAISNEISQRIGNKHESSKKIKKEILINSIHDLRRKIQKLQVDCQQLNKLVVQNEILLKYTLDNIDFTLGPRLDELLNQV